MRMKPAQKELVNLIHEEFTRLKTKNPSYSLRSFSKRLQLPISAVSGILNRVHPVTKKTGEKVLAALAVEPIRANRILAGLEYRRSATSSDKLGTTAYVELNMDDFHLISEWYCFGILSLAETQGFVGEVEDISQRLGIQLRQAKSALTRLERMGLLARNKKNEFIHSGKSYQTSQGIPNPYLRKHHQENLNLAQRAMQEDEFGECDFSGITMAIDPKKMPEAKKKITQFRREMSELLEKDQKKQVYRMNVQLFPLSDRNNKDKKT